MTEPRGTPVFTVWVEETPTMEINHRRPSTNFPHHTYQSRSICTNILPSCCYMNCSCSRSKPPIHWHMESHSFSCPQEHHFSDYPLSMLQIQTLFLYQTLPIRIQIIFLKKKIKRKSSISPHIPLLLLSILWSPLEEHPSKQLAKVTNINSYSIVFWTYFNLTFVLKTPPKPSPKKLHIAKSKSRLFTAFKLLTTAFFLK